MDVFVGVGEGWGSGRGGMTAANVSPFSPKRTCRPPKEMVPMEPALFAAQLISRLESLKRKQDTINSLEERLQQIQEVCVPQFSSLEKSMVRFYVIPQLMTLYVFTRRRKEKRQRSWQVPPSSLPTP